MGESPWQVHIQKVEAPGAIYVSLAGRTACKYVLYVFMQAACTSMHLNSAADMVPWQDGSLAT